MTSQLIFASANLHKTEEIRQMLEGKYEVLNLDDLGCETDIPETATTFDGNASLKSAFVEARYRVNCFADDSGLEVSALGGAPGVYSARYSGDRDPAKNLELLLQNLHGITDRQARFITVISLRLNGREYFFEGSVEGSIALRASGNGGFGYDPVFIPAGYARTFAEMLPEEKNQMSHRAIAVRKMVTFLLEQAS